MSESRHWRQKKLRKIDQKIEVGDFQAADKAADKLIIQELEEKLKRLQYTPRFILEAEFLFQFLENSNVDLILLDVYMPGTDGITLLERLKAHPTFQSLPVVMLTAEVNDQLTICHFLYGSRKLRRRKKRNQNEKFK